MEPGRWEEVRAAAVKLEQIRLRDPLAYKALQSCIGQLLGEAQKEEVPGDPVEHPVKIGY